MSICVVRVVLPLIPFLNDHVGGQIQHQPSSIKEMLLEHFAEAVRLHDVCYDDVAAGHQRAAAPGALPDFWENGIREKDQEIFIRNHGLGFTNAFSD